MVAIFWVACSGLAIRVPVRSSIISMAEGGPPPIDWQEGKVTKNELLSRGTRLLQVQADEDIDYKAGHILGLEVSPEEGEPLKGPYTVTRADTSSRTFDVIYRIIDGGRKTPFMDTMNAGASLRFGGRFGVPIGQGIAEDATRVVGIATGAGIGPLLGFAEEALADPSGPKLELYVGFREKEDICCAAECDALQEAYPERFLWWPCLSQTTVSQSSEWLKGRVSKVVPQRLGTTSNTHFHIVGNGQAVKDFQQGLLAGGVDEDHVTTEIYFNGKTEADDSVVDTISSTIKALPGSLAGIRMGRVSLLERPEAENLSESLRTRLGPVHQLERSRASPAIRSRNSM